MAPNLEVRWRKSSLSSGQGECVEVAHTLDRIRDSKNPNGPELRASVEALLRLARNAG